MSTKTRRTSIVGDIVNLMSVDAQMFMDLMPYLHAHVVVSYTFLIVLALIFLWFSMSPSIFAGFFMMVLLIPHCSQGRQYQVSWLVGWCMVVLSCLAFN